MKKLILVRHAKSDRKGDPAIADIDRPLAERGRKEAAQLAKFLQKEDLIPELIFCSPSVRTRETLTVMLKKWDKEVEVNYKNKIYDNDKSQILKLISKAYDSIGILMVIGHNPSIEDLANQLSNGRIPFGKFSTSGAAAFELEIDSWGDVINERSKLILYYSPKKGKISK